jgi:hypothetical protein
MIQGNIFTPFYLKLTNGPNKLACYFKLCWEILQGTNTLAHWAYVQTVEKIKCCVYNSKHQFKTLHSICNSQMGPII